MQKEKFKEYFKSRISDLIDDLKDLKGISLKQQAKQLGINFGTLAKYKRGELLPVADVIYKMAKYYNVSADYLLCLSNSKAANINDRELVDTLHLSDVVLKDLKNPLLLEFDDYTYNPIPAINYILKSDLILYLDKYWRSGLSNEERKEYDALCSDWKNSVGCSIIHNSNTCRITSSNNPRIKELEIKLESQWIILHQIEEKIKELKEDYQEELDKWQV